MIIVSCEQQQENTVLCWVAQIVFGFWYKN